jgi:hypothetical protein
MSYTAEELIEIAANVEAYRVEGVADVFYEDTTGALRRQEIRLSEIRKEKLFNIVSELYKLSDGVNTKEEQTERIPY